MFQIQLLPALFRATSVRLTEKSISKTTYGIKWWNKIRQNIEGDIMTAMMFYRMGKGEEHFKHNVT